MISIVLPISKAGLDEACITGKAADPIAMQESIKMFGRMADTQMIKIGVPHPIVRQLLQFKEGEVHLAARLERAKGVGGVEIGFTWIEMGEHRPVKDHVQRRVGSDDPRGDIEQNRIAGALASQFVEQFLHDIGTSIIAPPPGADKRLRRATAAATQIVDFMPSAKP